MNATYMRATIKAMNCINDEQKVDLLASLRGIRGYFDVCTAQDFANCAYSHRALQHYQFNKAVDRNVNCDDNPECCPELDPTY